MYIPSAKFNCGRFLLNRRMAINKVLNSLTEMSDTTLNKIFKKGNFNFFKKLNFKRFKVSSQQIFSALSNVISELFIEKQFS